MSKIFLSELQKSIKEKRIYTFSCTALILAIVNCYTFLIHLTRGDIDRNFSIGLYFVMLALNIASFILLVVCLRTFYKKNKVGVITPILFAILALFKILQLLEIINLIEPIYSGYYSYSDGNVIYRIIFDIIFIISCLLSIRNTLNNSSKILPILICVISGIAYEWSALSILSSYVDHFSVLDYEHWSFFIDIFVEIFSKIFLYISLGLFCIKHKMPVLSSNLPPKAQESESTSPKNDISVSPEQALTVLKNKLDLNMITEEEYNMQRAEIISKL